MHRSVLLVAGSANFSTRDVWDGYRIALELAGIRVVPYPTFSHLKILSADKVCTDIIGTALDESNAIDAVIFVDGLYFRGKKGRVPLSVRRAGIPTILIATDDPYDPIPNVESLYTYRFTNDRSCEEDGVWYLPTATMPLPEVPRVAKPKYAVSFLGTVFQERLPLLEGVAEWCEEHRQRFVLAGKIPDVEEDPFRKYTFTETRYRTIDHFEKLEIYSQSALTLNLFRDSETAVSPSPRVFEVTAFGQAALVTGPARSEVDEIYGETVYRFQSADDLIGVIETALSDSQRVEKAATAKEITLRSHLYEHRARQLVDTLQAAEADRSTGGVRDDKIAWIIGCGRSGSTWLAELMGDLPGIRKWHEPYFGRFFKHIQDRPDDLDRPSSFFSMKHRGVWLDGLRDLFFEMVRDRYPQFGRHALAVKEVNTPELYGWLGALFPAGRLILLIRDPYDVLDSYLDLQKPGSWNDKFGDGGNPLEPASVRRTAEHIRSTMELAFDAYERFDPERRLCVSYEELLVDGTDKLRRAAALVGADVDDAAIEASVAKHAFSKHQNTGEREFRRKGQAGVWRTSPNFNSDVRRISAQVLGRLRAKLGYESQGDESTTGTPDAV